MDNRNFSQENNKTEQDDLNISLIGEIAKTTGIPERMLSGYQVHRHPNETDVELKKRVIEYFGIEEQS